MKNRTFRTVSSYFLKEVEDILKNIKITRKFGWFYIEGLNDQLNKKDETKQSNFS